MVSGNLEVYPFLHFSTCSQMLRYWYCYLKQTLHHSVDFLVTSDNNLKLDLGGLLAFPIAVIFHDENLIPKSF